MISYPSLGLLKSHGLSSVKVPDSPNNAEFKGQSLMRFKSQAGHLGEVLSEGDSKIPAFAEIKAATTFSLTTRSASTMDGYQGFTKEDIGKPTLFTTP